MLVLSRRSLIGIALPAIAAASARAQDAEDYPTHPVTFIVPFAPAGGTDTIAHMLAQKLEQRLGKPLVVENRPGSGTVIGTNFVAKSPADGYTIMMTVSSVAIDVTLYRKLPYDPLKDLALVALVASVPFVLVVNTSLPVHSVDDLVKLARERPLSYGSGGIGAFHHIAAALFCSMTGIKATHVPYRGTVPALGDLVGGYLQFMFTDYGPAQQLLNAGKVRPLAVTTKQPLHALRDIPPLADAGVPGYDIAAWQGVVAPAKTPKGVLDRLNGAINAIVAMDDVRARLNDLGMDLIGTGSVDDLHRFLEEEIVRWGKIVNAAGLAGTE